MTSPNSAIAEKRDLHVGGLGVQRVLGNPPAPESNLDSAVEASDYFMRKVRDVVHSAEEVVRDNPWVALAAVAFVGLTCGYFLSRRA